MPIQRVRFLLVIGALASIGSSCAAPASSTFDVVVDVSSASSTAPTAPPALCVATSEDAASRAFFRAYLGDAIVLKLSAMFEDHADVASLLVANGATSAEPFLTESALLETDRLSVPIVATGGDLRALEPYVRAGTLAQMGPTDVAIAESAAIRLGVGRGGKVTLVRGEGAFQFSRPRKARRGVLRVAAILRFPGDAIHHYGDRTIFMTLDGLRSVGAASPIDDPTGLTPPTRDETTGVRVTGDPKLTPAWAELLEKRSAPSSSRYRLLAMAELADPGYTLGLESAIAVCAPNARSGPLLPATPRPDTLRPCDDLAQLDASKEARAALFGHGYAIGPEAAAADEKAIAREATRVDRGVALSGAVASGAGIRFATIDALDARRRAILATHVVSGDLSKLAASRGVALSIDLAAALGLDVGGELVVHATQEASTATSTYRAWRAPVVAIVRLPAEAVHRVGLEWVWADEGVIRSEWSLPGDAFNIVRIQWPESADEVSFLRKMAGGITPRSVLDTPNQLELNQLETACATSP